MARKRCKLEHLQRRLCSFYSKNDIKHFKARLSKKGVYYVSHISGRTLLSMIVAIERPWTNDFVLAIIGFLPTTKEKESCLNQIQYARDNAIYISMHSDITTTRLLLELGADPNMGDLLFYSVNWRKFSHIELLLRYGSCPTRKTIEWLEGKGLYEQLNKIRTIQLLQVVVSPKDVRRLNNDKCKIGLLPKDIFRELIKYLL